MKKENIDLLILDGAAVDGTIAATKNFQPFWVENTMSYAVQITFTGTPAGNFKLQASCDKGQPQAVIQSDRTVGVVNWTDIATTQTTVSAAGNILYNVEIAGYSGVRVVYTATGAGTAPVASVMRAVIKG